MNCAPTRLDDDFVRAKKSLEAENHVDNQPPKDQRQRQVGELPPAACAIQVGCLVDLGRNALPVGVSNLYNPDT